MNNIDVSVVIGTIIVLAIYFAIWKRDEKKKKELMNNYREMKKDRISRQQ